MKLDRCPPSPNCVCSQEDPSDTEHYIEALGYHGPTDAAIDAIAQVIESSARATITNRSENRIDAVFVSMIFRFKDDVSFLIDADDKKIHFRSASRVGKTDLGVNRKRLAALVPQIKAEL
jgi:uncharacterized protein (DUF1499 family)